MSLSPFGGVMPSLGHRVFVHDAAIVIGQVSIGDDASLWPFAVARGDVNTISVGARTNIQDGTILHVTHDGPYSPGGLGLVIGEDVTVGHHVALHACRVGNFCLIGIGATVLDGAVAEDEVLVAAGSLVPPGRHLESRGLYRGRPAERVRELTDGELEMLHYSAAHYVRLKDKYLAQLHGFDG